MRGRRLGELAEVHLIDEYRQARYRFHDLLRTYSGELSIELDSRTERRAAARRMFDHYVHRAHGAALRVEPAREAFTLGPTPLGVAIDDLTDRATALAWFTDERRALLGLVDAAAEQGFDRHAWQLAWSLTDFLHRNGHWHDWARSQRSALEAAQRLDDRQVLAMIHRNLGFAYVRLEHHDDALRHSRRALALHRDAGDLYGQANAHLNLGGIALILARQADQEAQRRARRRTALRHADRAVGLFHAADDRANEAYALNSVGWAYAQLGEHRRAIEVCERALKLLEAQSSRSGQAQTWDSLGYAHRHLGAHAEAVRCYRRAVELHVELGDRNGEAEALISLGDAHRDAGDCAAARSAWGRGSAILVELGRPRAYALG